MDSTYPLVPIANSLACFLVLISVGPGIFRSVNIGVSVFGIWIAIRTFDIAVNTIVWSDNANNVAPVWCDITSHLDIGGNIAIPVCSFVIARGLSRIARLCSISVEGKSRKEITFEFFLCIGLPIIGMGLYYVVQGARFEIWEMEGCTNALQTSGVSILLIDGWKLLLPAISVVFYCPRIIWSFFRHRKEMNEFLDSTSSVSRTAYYRMLALGCLDAFITLPIAIWDLIQGSIQGRIVFYQGWTDLHTEWEPLLVPASGLESSGFWNRFNTHWDDWIDVFWAIVVFLLFGTTVEARARYWHFLLTIVKGLGFAPSVKPATSEMVFGSVVSATSSSGDNTRHEPSLEYRDNRVDVFTDSSGAEKNEALNLEAMTRVIEISINNGTAKPGTIYESHVVPEHAISV